MANRIPITNNKVNIKTIIPEDLDSKRLDQALAELVPEYSRNRLKSWIIAGQVKVDGKKLRPRDKVHIGQKVEIKAAIEPEERWEAEPIALNIVYEDADIIVLNKPAGLVVHPAPGSRDKTMLNALLYHAPELANLPRAGIIHRLDKDTSGLLVVARNLQAHTKLVAELQARNIKREYEAIVTGVMTAGGTVDAPIGRHPRDRKRMTVIASGKQAITHYRVIKRFLAHTHIKVTLETGRTHQIRVHMAYIHYPIVGDPVYGVRLKLPAGISDELREALQNFKRQALHSRRLGLIHPVTNKPMEWQTPLPDDMQQLLKLLNKEQT
jgi:23S rRNA pseudouridine1911/1915/1917 synthase